MPDKDPFPLNPADISEFKLCEREIEWPVTEGPVPDEIMHPSDTPIEDEDDTDELLDAEDHESLQAHIRRVLAEAFDVENFEIIPTPQFMARMKKIVNRVRQSRGN